MIRRSLLTIGLLLLPGTLSAQALSPWVQGVIETANRGMETARRLPSASCESSEDLSYRDDALNGAISTVRQYVDTRFQLTQESRRLREQTACLKSDLALLESMLAQIHEEMLSGAANCQLSSLAVLTSVYDYVASAHRSLTIGGLDPQYIDDRLHYFYYFEEPIQADTAGLDRTPIANSDSPLCPFSTDYAPRSLAVAPDGQIMSYGCDGQALRSIAWLEEALPLKQFIDDTDSFSQSLATAMYEFLKHFQDALNVLRHTSDSAPLYEPIPNPPPHGKVDGCLSLPFPPQEGIEEYLEDYPEYTLETSSPSPGSTLPLGLKFRPTLQPFSLFHPFGLIRQFIERKEVIGLTRPLPGGAEPTDAASFYQWIFWLEYGFEPTTLRNLSIDHERSAGFAEAWSRDPIERTAEIYEPLAEATKKLAIVVESTLPTYIVDVSYLFRRYCVYGYCSTTLENVLKRILNPNCHPYTSGTFLTDKDYVGKCYCEIENEYCPKDASSSASTP